MSTSTEPATRARDRDRSDTDRLQWIGALSIALTMGAAGWLRRWTTDDAFINYRIVDQIFAGNGPVFNGGERVEAATSPLWLALLTIGDLVTGLPLEWVAIAMSIPLVMAGIVAMSVASTRLLSRPDQHDRPIWVPAGTLVLAAITVMWDFTTAGLETGLNLAWIGAVALVLARAIDEPEALPWWTLVLVGLGPLVRPDEAITTLAALAFVVVGTWGASRRRAVGQVAVALALPLAFQLFRMAYYGVLVPNTVLAKGSRVAHWREGWAYLLDFAGSYLIYVPLALIAIAVVPRIRTLSRRRQLAVVTLPVAALVHGALVVSAGGDYIHGRLLLPPLFALVAPVAMVPLRRNVAALPVVGLAVWAALCAGFLRPDGREVGASLIGDGRQAIVGALGVEHPVTAADQGWGKRSARAAQLRSNTVTVSEVPLMVTPPPDLATPAAALYGIGVTSYSAGTDVYVLDRLGLADPLTARFQLTRAGFIGHEKPIPGPWLAARLSSPGDDVPESLLNETGFSVALYQPPPGRFDADTEAARRVLECQPLRDLETATTARLTPGRALSNLLGAVKLTTMSVPGDPAQAEQDLC